MLDVRRTQHLTELYAHLQGLRLVPLALCFLGSALWRAGFLTWLPGIAGKGAQAWFLAGLGLSLIGSFPIGALYTRSVGATRPRLARTGAVTLATCFACFLVLTTLPPNSWSVSVPVVFVALTLVYVGLANRAFRPHYLGIAMAWFAFAIAPLIGVPGTARDVALDLLIALSLLVAGVGDHVVLRRTLRAAANEEVSDARAA
jgi:hypothetical protein